MVLKCNPSCLFVSSREEKKTSENILIYYKVPYIKMCKRQQYILLEKTLHFALNIIDFNHCTCCQCYDKCKKQSKL